MLPFLGIDITHNKKNEHRNGKEFLVATPTYDRSRRLEETAETLETLESNAGLPLWLNILYILCLVISGLVFLLELELLLDISEDMPTLKEAYAYLPGVFWVGTACQLFSLAMGIYQHIRSKKMTDDQPTLEAEEAFSQVAEEIFMEFQVPEDAPDVDIIGFTYRMKKDQPVAREQGAEITPYTNLTYRVFADETHLYLADLEEKYAIPLSSLTAIRTQHKKISVFGWSKDIPPTEEGYKEYRLRMDEYGNVYIKSYHILEFQQKGQLWGLYFPCYELPLIQQLTGLTAESSPKKEELYV